MDQKIIIAKNLTELRKQAKLTQQELAEKLNYTDKAVSKWERGEALPDIIVLKQLADMYGVKVDDFLYEHTQPVTPQTPVYKKRKIANRLLVALLSAGLVWLVATVIVVFTLLFIPKFTEIFLAYLVAVPVTAIVLLVFNVMWGKRYVSAILVSVLVWVVVLHYRRTHRRAQQLVAVYNRRSTSTACHTVVFITTHTQ